MWPFRKIRKKRTLSRFLAIEKTFYEYDRLMFEIRPYIEPIIGRALEVHSEYTEGNELGEFEISQKEDDIISDYAKIVSDTDERPIMYLGMKLKVI